MQRLRGFSLVEVTLAIGIIAISLLAILALVPVGLNSGREAIDATHIGLIAHDVQTRTKSSITSATFVGADITLLPWYYDREGVFVDVTSNGYGSVIYRAEATIHSTWNSVPPNIDATVLRPVTVNVGWPIDPTTHAAVGSNGTSFTFNVRKP
jgi:uncharacterized protein (TIGR02598 family)